MELYDVSSLSTALVLPTTVPLEIRHGHPGPGAFLTPFKRRIKYRPLGDRISMCSRFRASESLDHDPGAKIPSVRWANCAMQNGIRDKYTHIIFVLLWPYIIFRPVDRGRVFKRASPRSTTH